MEKLTSENLPRPCAQVMQAAKRIGLEIEIRQMDQSTRTAREAAAAIGCDVAQIVKSLIFQGQTSNDPILLLVSGSNRVDENTVADEIGETIIRPDAAFVRQVTGFSIGGIPPFGHVGSLKSCMDRDLLDHAIVYAAAGTPHTIFGIHPEQLAGVTQSTIMAMQ